MSVYDNPETHAANPPDTWTVVHVGARNWQVHDQAGTVLEYATTKKAALELIESGFQRRLYDKETRWYAGETIPGWRPYTDVAAEQTARRAARAARAARKDAEAALDAVQ